MAHACRLTGRAKFRKELVSREGILIEVPSSLSLRSAAQLATYLEPRLEAAVGGSLETYRKTEADKKTPRRLAN